ncbi:predicted protein, partial [Nematostella vectensis]
MTSYASLRSAVDSMKMGAVDYIAKPFDHDEMLQAVARILRDYQQIKSAPARAAGTAKASADKVVDNSNGEIGIIGSCPAMQEMYSKIRKVAPTDSNVLIQGESGTGKELVARALHNLSRRAKAPLISVNCAAIPESLIESELFGHEKGAFTGASAGRAGLVEAADGGTLFLDEIGELPLEAQARLLRVLQEGEIRRVGSVQSQKVDVRLIAATHRDLKTLSKIGQFREDLYYRLHVIALKLPPLRERGADVIEIARAFLIRQSTRQGRLDLSFANDAEQAIRHYPWPGNVRELENAIERALFKSFRSPIRRGNHSHSTPEVLSSSQHPIERGEISRYAISVVERLQQAGYQAYLVGGCVRDLLLDIEPKDFDVATSATPEQVRAEFRNARVIGRRFKLVHVHFGREIIETATFRANHPEGDEDENSNLSSRNESGRILRDN